MEAVAQVKGPTGEPSVQFKKNKRPIHAWIVDKTSSSFVTSSLADSPPNGDMWKLNLPDDNSRRRGSEDSKEQQIEVKLYSGMHKYSLPLDI